MRNIKTYNTQLIHLISHNPIDQYLIADCWQIMTNDFPRQYSIFDLNRRIMGEEDLHLASLVCRKRQPFPERDQQIIGVDFLEPRMIDLWIAVHIEQAVAFPMHIGEFGDDITLNAFMGTHILDFKFEGIVL